MYINGKLQYTNLMPRLPLPSCIWKASIISKQCVFLCLRTLSFECQFSWITVMLVYLWAIYRSHIYSFLTLAVCIIILLPFTVAELQNEEFLFSIPASEKRLMEEPELMKHTCPSTGPVTGGWWYRKLE